MALLPLILSFLFWRGVASFPGLPCFFSSVSFSIIHGSGRTQKRGRAEHLSRK